MGQRNKALKKRRRLRGRSKRLQRSASKYDRLRECEQLHLSRGFAECSVQEMVNKLTNHTCLSQQFPTITNVLSSRKGSLPVCGNGLLEDEEECDCGPDRWERTNLEVLKNYEIPNIKKDMYWFLSVIYTIQTNCYRIAEHCHMY